MIWCVFNNCYWLVQYFVDVQGNIRGYQFGEGNYVCLEQMICCLLIEVGQMNLLLLVDFVVVELKGVVVQVDMGNLCLLEIYLGYVCVEQFVLFGGQCSDVVFDYFLLVILVLN